jgi:hypothetical protein
MNQDLYAHMNNKRKRKKKKGYAKKKKLLLVFILLRQVLYSYRVLVDIFSVLQIQFTCIKMQWKYILCFYYSMIILLLFPIPICLSSLRFFCYCSDNFKAKCVFWILICVVIIYVIKPMPLVILLYKFLIQMSFLFQCW